MQAIWSAPQRERAIAAVALCVRAGWHVRLRCTCRDACHARPLAARVAKLATQFAGRPAMPRQMLRMLLMEAAGVRAMAATARRDTDDAASAVALAVVVTVAVLIALAATAATWWARARGVGKAAAAALRARVDGAVVVSRDAPQRARSRSRCPCRRA